MAPDGTELDAFGQGARRAVGRGELEARELGHDRVGTEHLLLGLLADTTSTAARALTAAGVTITAARHKVREARPPRAAPSAGSLPSTPRAARAIARAVRFAHTRRAEAVETEHLLLGVLDVEGTAGQVLRGLGLDVDQLRVALDAPAPTEAPEMPATVETPEPAPEPPPVDEAPAAATATATRCPICGAGLDDGLLARHVPTSGAGDRAAVVFACPACGAAIGAAPA